MLCSDFSTLHRSLDGTEALVLRADRRDPLAVLRFRLRQKSPILELNNFRIDPKISRMP
jgi:hypothetical protein